MHSLVTGYLEVDHANHNGLDNQKHNLRDGTHQQNTFNQRSTTDAASQHKGVCWFASNQKWVARIMVDGQSKYLGCFTNEEDAARAYAAAAQELHGDYAWSDD
jgi:hypothetical protein